MNEDEKDIELLERYHNHALGDRERTAVEQRLKEDESFRDLDNDFKVLLAGIREVSRKNIKHELEQIEAKQATRVVPFRTWAVGIAASVVLVVVAYWLWPRPTEGEKLFAQYFEPYPNVIMPTVRGDLEPDTTLMAKAYRAYDREDYQSAISLFEQLKAKDEGTLLYLGNSYLAIGQTQQAVALFLKLKSDYHVFDEQAEWYLVLCYLQLNENGRAKKAVDELIGRDSPYDEKAKQLLKILSPK